MNAENDNDASAARKKVLKIADCYADELHENGATGFAEAYAKVYAAKSLEELGTAVDELGAIYNKHINGE